MTKNKKRLKLCDLYLAASYFYDFISSPEMASLYLSEACHVGDLSAEDLEDAQ